MQARARWLALAWLAVTMLLSPAVAEEKVLHDGSRYEGEVNHAGGSARAGRQDVV